MKNIKEKAEYCLNCKTKTCTIGCPLGNDIPGFIKCVKDGEYNKAYKILTKTSVLQSICGRICPHMQQCMGKCIRGIKQDPVSIGDLEAFVGDIALKENFEMEELKKDCLGKKIAVVGSGPAGLTCAGFLARRGAKVTIYEKHEKLGGILRYGIPNFRLDKNILDKVIDKILSFKIDVKTNKEIGKTFFLEDLQTKYDAIFLGIGANIPWKMGIEGENLEGVYGGNMLLEKQNHPNYDCKNVAVIGGGNVAMDVARTIKKLGAKNVTIIYRRSEKQMPADIKEIKEAKKDGVKFLFQNNIVKIIGDKRVKKIECVKTELIKKEGETREIPINIPNSTYVIDMDYVVMAIGSKTDKEIINNLELDIDKNGYIKVNEKFETFKQKVFAGGDLVGTKATVAWASYNGRMAAESIVNFLNNKT